MTLDEAIKILNELATIPPNVDPFAGSHKRAFRLGSEALERMGELRIEGQKPFEMSVVATISSLIAKPLPSEEEGRIPYYASGEWKGEYIEEGK